MLEGNADPNVVGGPQGISPLHIAAHHNAIEICKLLMEYGGDPYLKDDDGDTPLDLVSSPDLRTYSLVVYLSHDCSIRISPISVCMLVSHS